MNEKNENAGNSRRGFLKMGLAATVGAVAGGASVAATVSQEMQTIIRGAAQTGSIESETLSLPPVITSADDNSQLNQQLVAAHAENMRLKAELEGANRKIAALSDQSDSRTGAMEAQLEEATLKIGSLTGLISLYEQLESLDLDGAVDEGLSVISGGMGSLAGKLPGVEQGVELAEEALSAFEAQIPLVHSGKQWLDNHVERLGRFVGALEGALLNAVESAAPFLEMLSAWFQKVLKWAPFGVGDSAAAVLDALTDLVTEAPHSINGLQTNVAAPLALWLADDDGDPALTKRLTKPIREQAMAPVASIAQDAKQLHEKFQAELEQPAQNVLKNRALVRDLIEKYRVEQGL